MESGQRRGGVRRLLSALRSEWTELSGLGRVALLGMLLSAAIAVALGFYIPAAARSHLIDSRAELLERVVANLSDRGLVPATGSDTDSLVALDEAVRLRLLGGEAVRVKVWSSDGTIVYSDAEALIGRTFPLGDHELAALQGETSVSVADRDEEENVFERGFGDLLEFYVPFRDDRGEVVGLFEVYQTADSLRASLADIRWNVWLSISAGLGVLGIFMGALTVATARAVNRRRNQAERLLAALLRAQEDERARIVEALHDDIGQPMYRVLYGLQGSRVHVEPGSRVDDELASLETVLRDMDHSLGAELKMLNQGTMGEVSLEAALEELIGITEDETGLEIRLRFDDKVAALEPVYQQAVFRTAQEALINIRKHADANLVDLRLALQGRRVLLEVADDGRGWSGREGLGLTIARERLEAIGGGLKVSQRGDTGLVLSAWVPAATIEASV